MRIGIGLPAAVPGADMTTLGQWAADSERAGFAAVGVIDRLVYDTLEPLTALAAAAARTERVELLTTVLYRIRGSYVRVLAGILGCILVLGGLSALLMTLFALASTLRGPALGVPEIPIYVILTAAGVGMTLLGYRLAISSFRTRTDRGEPSS